MKSDGCDTWGPGFRRRGPRHPLTILRRIDRAIVRFGTWLLFPRSARISREVTHPVTVTIDIERKISNPTR